jgi:H+/gluconate symporter-like permease
MGFLGILFGLGLLIWLAFRGWSVLLLAPAAALIAALFGGQPLLANWTQVFMGSAARLLAQFFPIFFSAPYSASSWMTAARCRPSLIS